MDFTIPYTEEQEQFRQEVRTWLEENIPDEMKEPIDPRDITEEMWKFWRGKHREMGEKGWLFPTYAKEYGGGGLTAAHATILEEELTRARAIRSTSTTFVFDDIIVWGTEEQKQKFLVPMLRGEKTNHQKLTEPKGGADLANYLSRAVRDGDGWILSGQSVFISAWGDEDYFPGPMLTNPDAPRHRNLGFFMIPNPSPGLEVRAMDLLSGDRQKVIFMDNVRVPGDHLIGGDHEGWQVMGTHLEAEHGGHGGAAPRHEDVDNLVSYIKEKGHDRGTLGSDDVIQQVAMDAVIEAHVQSLLTKRTYWMYQNGMNIQYEGNLSDVHDRESGLRNARRVREIYGMYGLLGVRETTAPHGGAQEVSQRSAAGQRHAGGSTNIAKVVLARRIGISRTQERAAPTPSTTSS